MAIPQTIGFDELGDVLLEFWSEMEKQTFERQLMELQPIVLADFADHFVQARGPNGAWPPRVRQYPWPILIKTGALKRAASERNAPGNIGRFNNGFAEFGASASVVKYAPFHEYGTSKLPPRPWAYLSEEAESAAAERFADLIVSTFL